MNARTWLAAFALMALAACAANPAKIAVTPESRNGLLVLQADPSPIPYSLNVGTFDAQRGVLTANPLHGWVSFDGGETSTGGYILREAPAGVYALADVDQQGAWAVCFHAQTLSFELHPGEVLYLGHFHPLAHLQQLQLLVIQSGHVTAQQGSVYHYFDNIIPPNLTAPTDADREAVRAFLSNTSPLTTAPVNLATYQAAQFGTGRDAFGIQRICGGYYAQGVQQQSPAGGG